MSSDSMIPKWEKPPDPPEGGGAPARTDFQSLSKEPAPTFAPLVTEQPRKKKFMRTDFQSLGGAEALRPKATVPRTLADWTIDSVTPFLIFTMTCPVLLFLVNMRFVYTEVNDLPLRIFAVSFLIGIVALNRLIARDGSEESIIYIFALFMAVALYTASSTGIHGTVVAQNFMNTSIGLALLFNMTVVGFLWWMVNRLTHECCVDENMVAGDMGLFTSTARRFQQAMRPREKAAPKLKYRTILEEVQGPMYDLEPFDPLEARAPAAPSAPKPDYAALAARLPKRHPGISIFYFSVPVLLVFSLGLRLIQHGGEPMVRAGWLQVLVYMTSALLLLMFTSLGGLREYYRQRRIAMPSGATWFWLGLGFFMTAAVILGAARLPLPGLPPLTRVEGHEYDPLLSRARDFQIQETDISPEALLRENETMRRIGDGVLLMFALFLGYALLKGLAGLAAWVARHRHRLPAGWGRFFDRLEGLLSRLTRLPVYAKRKRHTRIQRDIATSVPYTNPAGDPARSARMSVKDHIEYAYEALCALAYDLGVPRELSQTPHEFLAAFPEELGALRAEAEDLTRLYLVAAYSPMEIDPRVQDRLRRFWLNYNRIRNRVVR